MGFVRAKIKTTLNYQKSTTSKHCGICAYFKLVKIYGIGMEYRHDDHRCEKIGFGNSIKYHIQSGYICDAYKEPYPIQE
ncbi:hypothetical protein HY745_13355 [Candidatus Desantisbacteria bacterium]|nr:hypothetical protein [Candidatus Desantisbacteria bacterium]